MPLTYTTIDDVDPEQRLWAVCTCGRDDVLLDLEAIRTSHGNLSLDDLKSKLKCAECGSRKCWYQIVYTC